MQKTLILIPSRLSASRLPNKPLLKINGKSIISLVVDRAKRSKLGEVIVATEDNKILNEVKKNGGNAIITSNKHKTGTDRIYECLTKLKNKNIGILITDHNVRETLKIVDKVYIVNEGAIFYEGDPLSAVKDEKIKKLYLGSNFQL